MSKVKREERFSDGVIFLTYSFSITSFLLLLPTKWAACLDSLTSTVSSNTDDPLTNVSSLLLLSPLKFVIARRAKERSQLMSEDRRKV
jgi:hypothetical protein